MTTPDRRPAPLPLAIPGKCHSRAPVRPVSAELRPRAPAPMFDTGNAAGPRHAGER